MKKQVDSEVKDAILKNYERFAFRKVLQAVEDLALPGNHPKYVAKALEFLNSDWGDWCSKGLSEKIVNSYKEDPKAFSKRVRSMEKQIELIGEKEEKEDWEELECLVLD